MRDDLIKDSKLHKDIKRNGIGAKKVKKEHRVGNAIKTIYQEILQIWLLIQTVAMAMASYILLGQTNWGDRIIGGVLLVGAITTAIKQYTKPSINE